MPTFQCLPIPTETVERFRQTGIDDRGNTMRSMASPGGTSAPCRHCLQFAQAGEPMLLGSYDLPRPRGIYWTPSPVFVHAGPCPVFDALDTIAPIVAQGVLVSVRAYDADDQCLYDLGQVCPGADVDAPLARALDDARTAFVNVHTARPGCLLTRIERHDTVSPPG